MPRRIVKRISGALAALVIAAVPVAVNAAGNPQPISGNGWVALGVVGLLIAVVVILIRGTMYIEDRHARMYGWRRTPGYGWFGTLHDSGDDDDESD